MPIYGYACSQCGHELEVFQSMSAEPLRVCPECSGSLRKLLYPVGVQFKGSGFYSTDYKGGSSSKNGRGDSGDKAEPGDKGVESDKTEPSGARPGDKTAVASGSKD